MRKGIIKIFYSKMLVLSLIAIFLLPTHNVLSMTDSNISNNILSKNITVIDTRQLSAYFTSVNYVEKFDQVVNRNTNFVNKTFPLSDNGLIVVKDSSTINSPDSLSEDLIQQGDELSQIRLDILTKVFLSKQKFSVAVGVIKENYLTNIGPGRSNATGLNFALGSADVILIDENQLKTLAHEIGHTFELCEEYSIDEWRRQNETLPSGCPNGDLNNDGDLDFNCVFRSGGSGCAASAFPFLYEDFGIISESTPLRSFMGASDTPTYLESEAPTNFETWISENTYDALLARFSDDSSFEVPTIGFITEPGPYVVIRIRYYLNSTIQFLNSYILEEGFVHNTSKFSGEEFIQVQDENGSIVSNITYNPNFLVTTEGGEGIVLNSTVVVFSLPLHNQNFTKIIVGNSSSEILTVNRSPNNPVVNSVSPINGSIKSSPFNVTWNASDIDNDTLEFALFMSNNNGVSWSIISTDISNNYYEIDNALYPYGEDYKFRVLASDKINTGENKSLGSITIIPPPSVSVNSFTEISSNQSHKIFRGVIENNGGQDLDYLQWTLNTSDEVVIASSNISLAPNEDVFVVFEYNYTIGGLRNVSLKALDTNKSVNSTYTQEFFVGDLRVANFSQVFTNGTQRIFNFTLYNVGPSNITGVNWSLDTDDGMMKSSSTTYNLPPYELQEITVGYNYSTGGDYMITITGISDLNNYTQMIGFEILDLNIDEYEIIKQNTSLVVFKAVTSNELDFSVNNISWKINTGVENITSEENHTLGYNQDLITLLEYNYSEFDVYQTVFTANNSLYEATAITTAIIKELNISQLALATTQDTLAAFRFVVTNILPGQKVVSWSFDTNETIITGAEAVTLEENEDVYIITEHNYSSAGTYEVIARANSTGTYEEALNVTIS